MKKLAPKQPDKVKALFNLDREADELLDKMVEPGYRSWFVSQLIYQAAGYTPPTQKLPAMLDKIQQ